MVNGFSQQVFISLSLFPAPFDNSMLNVTVQFLYGPEKTLVAESGMHLCDWSINSYFEGGTEEIGTEEIGTGDELRKLREEYREWAGVTGGVKKAELTWT